MADRASWGILGTGKIAHLFAREVQKSVDGNVVAVASRSIERGTSFAREFGIPVAHQSYEALVSDPRVDFIYVATPHTTHAALAMAAASAGKAVLCEKPLAENAVIAARMIDHARECRTLLMEAFAFRSHVQTRELVKLIETGEMGELRSVTASFGYDAGPAPTNYLLRNDLGGGSILDVGCYTVALTRQLAGAAAGEPFRNPTRLSGVGLYDQDHAVDLDATAVAWFENGITGLLACSIRTNLDSIVQITTSEGFVSLPTPWLPGMIGGQPRIEIRRRGEPLRQVVIDEPRGLYAVEADTVVARAREGRVEAPEMSWADSLGNMEALDDWRSDLGVRYATDPLLTDPGHR
jgi:predicted dehydrogenase